MTTRLMTLALAVVFSTAGLSAQENPNNSKAEYHKAFVEDFNKPTSKYFMQRRDRRDEATDFRYFPGNVSLSEKGKDVLLYRIDPNDPAGAV